MRKSLYLLLFICLPIIAVAQKKAKDIDILYHIYKNSDSISVTNANGTVNFKVSKIMNINGLPQSIILTGYANNSTLAESIINKLEATKVKSGYKYSTSSFQTSDLESLNVFVYIKGSQYAKYGFTSDLFGKNDSPPPYNTGTDKQKRYRTQKYFFASMGGCYIYMEIGDIARKIIGQPESFKF